MSNVYIIGDKDYLMHHGIKGQKWGVENGPPYPLNPSKDYSDAEQKANAKILAKEYKKVKRKTGLTIAAANTISKNKIILENIDDLKQSREKLEKTISKMSKLKDNIGTEHPIIYDWENATKEYYQQIDKLAHNIVGAYGNIKVANAKNSRQISDIKNAVNYAIEIAADRRFDPNSEYSDFLNDTLERIGYL